MEQIEGFEQFKSKVDKTNPGQYKISNQNSKPNGEDSPLDEIDIPLYSVDSLVRRADALQKTLSARNASGGK